MNDIQKKQLAAAALKGLTKFGQNSGSKTEATACKGGKYDANECGTPMLCAGINS